MERRGSHVVLPGILFLLLLWFVGAAQAADKPVPPQSNAYGGYAELAAGWMEWVTHIPGSTNPLFDVDGSYAALEQSGKVWFLVGTTTNGTPITRKITIPSGTALFFPIVNYFWVNTPEYGDAPWSPTQYEYARDILDIYVDTADDVTLKVDGRSVPTDQLRVLGAVGACDLPVDDNIFNAPLEPVIHECFADGYWALLPPLSVGKHIIHFTGGITAAGFALDVTYNITVKPRQQVLNGAKVYHP